MQEAHIECCGSPRNLVGNSPRIGRGCRSKAGGWTDLECSIVEITGVEDRQAGLLTLVLTVFSWVVLWLPELQFLHLQNGEHVAAAASPPLSFPVFFLLPFLLLFKGKGTFLRLQSHGVQVNDALWGKETVEGAYLSFLVHRLLEWPQFLCRWQHRVTGEYSIPSSGNSCISGPAGCGKGH